MPDNRTALVLTGGGARAAYQVGVLRAIAHIRGRRGGNPFAIICGTSAGAINATALAMFADEFDVGVRKLTWLWRNLSVDQIYRADATALLATGVRWGAALTSGWLIRQTPRSLLDNSPLRQLIDRLLDTDSIERVIASGALRALSVSASGYSSGQNLTFYQGSPELLPWRRAQRLGIPARIKSAHLLASSAIPFVFPAVRINREYFGDGSMRQLAPVSPAVHLGAERILVIGSGRLAEEGRLRTDTYPTPAQIAGHALSSIFLDGLAVDLERLDRINQTLSVMTPEQVNQSGTGLRVIKSLVISPSHRLDAFAADHRDDLPLALQMVLRGFGAMRPEGSALLSYLLFEQGYIKTLMDLGYQDALAQRHEIIGFLEDR